MKARDVGGYEACRNIMHCKLSHPSRCIGSYGHGFPECLKIV